MDKKISNLMYFNKSVFSPHICVWLGGVGGWGKQVGSMNEESQVSGCYNITFNYTTRKQCRLSPEMNTGHNSRQTTCLCRDTGVEGMLPAQRTSFNTLDNRGHKTPTQSKKRKDDRKEKVKQSWPWTHTMHSVTSILAKNCSDWWCEL